MIRLKIPGILVALPLIVTCGPDGQAESGNDQRTETAAQQAAAATGMPSPPADERTPDSRSMFTSIGKSECRLLEENLQEGGFWRRRCRGHAGYTLERSESDLRQDLVVIARDGDRTQLLLSPIVARGVFNSLGDTVEWRGRDPSHPQALIVRVNVMRGSDPEAPDISNLVVVRLDGPVCAVTVVPPQPGQNERAREVADRGGGTCLKEPGA